MMVVCKTDFPDHVKYPITPGKVYEVIKIGWSEKDYRTLYLICNDKNKPSYVPRKCFKAIGKNTNSIDLLYKNEKKCDCKPPFHNKNCPDWR